MLDFSTTTTSSPTDAETNFPVIVNSPNVETRGEFIQGGDAIFFFYFPGLNGDLYDPSVITVDIVDPDGATIEEDQDVEPLEGHQYVFQWTIPDDADTGLYRLLVNYTIESTSGQSQGQYIEEFVVTSSGTDYLRAQAIAAVNFLEMFLGYTQRLPVFNETGRLDSDRKIAKFTFPRWNQPAGVNVYVNGSPTRLSYGVDYLKGRIEFEKSLSVHDEVTADYNFRWFSFEELAQFIDQGVQIFNQHPPHSSYTIYNIEVRYGITVVSQAAVFAIRRLIMDLMFQEPVKVFGGTQRADNIMQRLLSLKENYENELKVLYEQKKYGPYVGLHKQIVTPEFSLPGGRSRWFRYLFKGA